VNTFLKMVVVVCVVGIAVTVGIGTRGDSTPQDVPVPTSAPASAPATTPLALTLAPSTDPSTTPPAGPTEPAQTEEPVVETPSPAFSIEELTAECDAGEGFGVTALPLGADWRVTERGVYSNSPVTITCEIEGSTDGLTYEWVADDGEVEGSGDSIVWTAPGHGAKVQVTVVVRNSSGDEESATLNFRVATCKCMYQRYE
jgi:hypothetical protein